MRGREREQEEEAAREPDQCEEKDSHKNVFVYVIHYGNEEQTIFLSHIFKVSLNKQFCFISKISLKIEKVLATKLMD